MSSWKNKQDYLIKLKRSNTTRYSVPSSPNRGVDGGGEGAGLQLPPRLFAPLKIWLTPPLATIFVTKVIALKML